MRDNTNTHIYTHTRSPRKSAITFTNPFSNLHFNPAARAYVIT